MDDDKILELTGQIESTLGKEQFATISDVVGEILTGNSENMKSIADRDAEIKKLEDRNQKLVTANGALLQKIPMEYHKTEEKEEQKEESKKVSLSEVFDKKGNFIH